MEFCIRRKQISFNKNDDFGSRITCVVGVGAAIDIGGPATDEITNDILMLEVFKKISVILDKYYGIGEYNFEDLLHLIENLETYKIDNDEIKNVYKPILGVFIEI